jgi:thiamine-monophosphate kinase
MDISDGLSTDLDHLCKASRLNAVVRRTTLPVHPTVERLGPGERERVILHGGEEYELLFTAPSSVRIPRKIAGVAVTQIGTMVRPKASAPRVVIIESDGEHRPLEPGGWQHFSDR